MTLYELNNLCRENNIPSDVELLSDSKWEYNETSINGVYYCKEKKVLVLTQGFEKEYENKGIGEFTTLYTWKQDETAN